jgi:hypothetical protein
MGLSHIRKYVTQDNNTAVLVPLRSIGYLTPNLILKLWNIPKFPRDRSRVKTGNMTKKNRDVRLVSEHPCRHADPNSQRNL